MTTYTWDDFSDADAEFALMIDERVKWQSEACKMNEAFEEAHRIKWEILPITMSKEMLDLWNWNTFQMDIRYRSSAIVR
jgi:hypothetical protein